MKGKRPPKDGSRFLHRRPELGYTHLPSLAMPGEPEAIDLETQRRFSRDARFDFDESRRLEHVAKLARERERLLALREAVDKRIEVLDGALGIKKAA